MDSWLCGFCGLLRQSAELSVGAEALETTPGSPKAAPLREDVVKEGELMEHDQMG